MPASDGGKRVLVSSKLDGATKINPHTAGQKIKNFFRINSSGKAQDGVQSSSDKGSLHGDANTDGTRTPQSQHTTKSTLRNSRFVPHLGRARSTTVVSEGNALDDAMSPTAHANPYFQHQGPPAIRHHDEGSIPPSPPDTSPSSKKIAPEGVSKNRRGPSGKEELARKLRRVASAPNAQGLFTKASKKAGGDSRPDSGDEDDLRALPKTNGLGSHSNSSAMSMVETFSNDPNLLPVPGMNGDLTPGKLRNSVTFRRTYSSNSIKVRNVEVGPGSFDKIKLIGKGDVGKVYLVREKKSSRLYAMKGLSCVVKKMDN